MANWITLKQLSEKRGIAESDLRTWANLGYITSSRIENVLMIDDESLTQYLDVHQTKDLGENYLEKIIKEKELEREVLLSQCDDELFLLKTQKLHQPLFHILIQEHRSGTDNQYRQKKEQSRTNPRSDLVVNPLIER